MSPEDSQGKTKTDADDNPSQFSLESHKTKTQPTTKEEDHSKMLRVLKDPHWWQAFAAVILIPVGAYALWIYGSQLDEMRKSTQAATDAIKLARDSSHLEQRAWVAPTSMTGKPEEGQPYKIKIEMTNSGKTFAKRFRAVALATRKELSAPDPDFASEAERAYIGEPVLLGPNARFSLTLEIFKGEKLTKEHMEFLRSPENVLLVFGKITYWDIFDCEHWTTFCGRCTIDGDCHTYGPYNNSDDNRCP